MSESGDYTPSPGWAGHDFSSARKAYDTHVGRSYRTAVTTGKKSTDLLPEDLETTSKSPLVIVVDQTGSMGEWPATMFSKLPYLEHEAKEYLGPSTAISFAAIGDARNNENYPVQARPFEDGPELKGRLEELVIEGKGGGSLQETYELAALYYARNVRVPLHSKGVIIFIGDEMPYDTISRHMASQYCHVTLQDDIDTADVFKELSEKFSVYMIMKPYGHGDAENLCGTSKRVHKRWSDLIGAERVAILPDAERVCDVIFGLLAEERDRFGDFMEEIEDRQIDSDGDRTKVDVVYRSLSTVHDFTSPAKTKVAPGNSRLSVHVTDDSEGDDLI